MKKYKNDSVLIVGILIISLILGGIIFLTRSDGVVVEVKVDGQIIKTLSLQDSDEFTIKTEQGYNVLQIKNGFAQVKKADCKDKICEKQGAISKAGESIVCLPHKVVIQVVGKKDDVDAIVK